MLHKQQSLIECWTAPVKVVSDSLTQLLIHNIIVIFFNIRGRLTFPWLIRQIREDYCWWSRLLINVNKDYISVVAEDFFQAKAKLGIHKTMGFFLDWKKHQLFAWLISTDEWCVNDVEWYLIFIIWKPEIKIFSYLGIIRIFCHCGMRYANTVSFSTVKLIL